MEQVVWILCIHSFIRSSLTEHILCSVLGRVDTAVSEAGPSSQEHLTIVGAHRAFSMHRTASIPAAEVRPPEARVPVPREPVTGGPQLWLHQNHLVSFEQIPPAGNDSRLSGWSPGTSSFEKLPGSLMCTRGQEALP